MQQARTQAATAATQARKAEPALTLSRRYKASLERVYGAFARQVHLARWFGPEGCAIEDCDWRPQAGRPWRLVMVHADGGTNPVGGVFREVLPRERLVFTWTWENTEYAGLETLVTIAFKALGDMTEVVLTHEWLPDAPARDCHGKGWTSSLESLADYLA